MSTRCSTAGRDLRFERDGDALVGPGRGRQRHRGDGTVSGRSERIDPPPGLAVAFTVGEEGLGNLRGARQVCRSCARRMAIARRGPRPGPGRHRARRQHRARGWRCRARAVTRGATGARPSALHALMPSARDWPTSGANVGRMSRRRRGQRDRRRGRDAGRAALARPGRARSRSRRGRGADGRPPLSLGMRDRRPPRRRADRPRAIRLCGASSTCGGRSGCPMTFGAGSTDANAAAAFDIPAVAIGCANGSGMHTLDERIDLTPLELGVRQLGAVLRPRSRLVGERARAVGGWRRWVGARRQGQRGGSALAGEASAVGQSSPARPSKASAAAPTIPASTPKRAATIRTVAGRGTAAPARPPRRAPGASSSSPAGDHPAADHHDLGVEDVDQAGDRHAEPRADQRDRLARRLVPVVGELGHERPGSSRPSASARAEPGVRAARRPAAWPRAPAPVPEANASTQPRLGQLPWHGGPSNSITMCPSSPATPIAPAVELAAEDQAAADPGPERHHDRLAGALGGAGAVLGDGGRVAVVVDEHRQPEPLGHHVGEGDVGERQVDATTRSRSGGRSATGSRSRPPRLRRPRLRAPRSPRRPPRRAARAGRVR